MLKDFRVHGEIGSIEYIALIKGMEAYNICFFEEEENGIRFFFKG